MPRLPIAALLALGLTSGSLFAQDVPVEQEVAKRVDLLIGAGLRDAGVEVVPQTSDADFMRRISLDIAGTLPTPEQVLQFEANRDPAKRAKTIDRLLASPGYARNWSRYWRDVILSRATNARVRFVEPRFEEWMTARLGENAGWDEIATELLTATGDVREVGSTALMFAHDGEPAEIAAETSRIFLGIQLSCANCHDHPYDSWKRDDFHTLAAYFPRVRVRAVQGEGQPRSFEVVAFDQSQRGAGQAPDFQRAAPFILRRFDGDGDGKLSKAEMEGSPLARFARRAIDAIDEDGDGKVSLKELQAFQPPMPQNTNRFATEYLMPDLANPGSPGDRVDPAFFVSKEIVAKEMSDADRRLVLAQQITEAKNPWFARAYVNRMWSEMLGEGFYAPVDDIGPQRSARFPEALEALAAGFTASGHDPRWLLRTIALTETYQRKVRSPDADQALPFASALPTRLRADAVFDSLVQALGVDEAQLAARGGRPGMGGAYRAFGPRAAFSQTFGFDPSTPQEDVIGNIPQALFLMNSDFVGELIRTNAPTKLGTLLYRHREDDDAIEQVYLNVLARRPTERELEICLAHIEAGDHRGEAYEDLMWSLLNSTEFISRR